SLHSAGVARDSVLAQSLRALHDRARKKDPRHRRALPERCLRREPALTERRDAEIGQVAQRGDETGCGDDVFDLEVEVVAVLRATGLDQVMARDALYRFDRRVE